MAIEKLVDDKGIYFITFTCHDWLPLIEIANAYNDVYKFFEVLIKQGNPIVGYVIMPNHLHFLLYYTTTEKNFKLYYWQWKTIHGLQHRKEITTGKQNSTD